MTSISERFRARKNRAMEFVVKFPTENPEYELTVKRIPEAVETNATNRTLGTLKERGVALTGPDASDDAGLQFYLWKCYYLVEQGASHFTGWKVINGETPPFSKPAFVEWLGILSADEKQLLGHAYLQAVQEAETEKKEVTDAAS